MAWVTIDCLRSTCLQEQAEAFWQTSCLDTLQSELAKSKSIPEKFYYKGSLTEYYQRFPFGTILQRSEKTTPNAPKHSEYGRRYHRNSPSAAGSRNCAKTLAAPEKEQESKESDQDCGEKWQGSFAKYDHDTHSWRTHQCSLFGGLEEFSGTWPRSGMMRDGACWELTALAHHTSGIESGSGQSWPTPRAGKTTDENEESW